MIQNNLSKETDQIQHWKHSKSKEGEEFDETKEPGQKETILKSELTESKITESLEKKKDIKFPSKPKKKFSVGIDFKILVNHFKLSLENKSKIFQYYVSLKNENGEEKISNTLGKFFLKKFLSQNPPYQNKVLYNFKNILYCTEPIQVSEVPFEDARGKKFTAFLKEAIRSREFELNDIKSSDEELVALLQMILLQNLKCSDEYFNFGNSFFENKEQARQQIGFGLDLIDGMFISVRPTEQGAAVNINKTNTTINQDKNLVEIICNQLKCRENDIKNKSKKDILKCLENFEFNDHLEKSVNLKNISNKNSRELKFRLKNEQREISVEQYFWEKYQKRLEYPNLPLLETKDKKFLPLELIYLKPGRRSNLNSYEQSEMIKKSKLNCQERQKRILELINELDFNNKDPFLKEYGIKIDPKMTEVTAKKIKEVTLEYGNNTKCKVNCGKWNNDKKVFYEPKTIRQCILVNCSDLNKNDLDKFVKIFYEQAGKMGLEIISRRIEKCDDFKIFSEKFIAETKIKKSDIDLMILIDNKKDSQNYKILKELGDIECGLLTQCIRQSAIIKNLKFIDQFCSNICLKVNCKLGGTNFKISPEDQNYGKYLKDITESDTMIFGIDVNHPTPIKQKSENSSNKNEKREYESIAAVVGSLDKNFCIYPASIMRQKKEGKRGLELVYNLKQPVYQLLQQYKKKNGKLPSKLIFFRDGVSDGQFGPVSKHELNEIRKACSETQNDYNPKISYIVVQKRHHTRFFPINPRDQASFKNENVPPGTVVDTVIVTPDKFDFFICSHLGIQGTSKPCHYYLLYDENNFDSNKLILLSFYLCHIYARSTTSVSYPAPTYYADLCAERGRKYELKHTYDSIESFDYETDRNDTSRQNKVRIESALFKIHENLRDKMFYI